MENRTNRHSLTDNITFIKSWAKQNAPGVKFKQPANSQAIEHFTRLSGLQFPVELRKLLENMDGETIKSAGMIGNWRLMPIYEIQAAWGLLKVLSEKGAYNELTPQPSPYLKSFWWYQSWLPFVCNDSGDYICLDCAPPEPKRFGQVLLYLHDQPERPLIASGLSAWFDRIARDLRAGVYEFNMNDGFNSEAFMWSALEEKHIFGNTAGKRIV